MNKLYGGLLVAAGFVAPVISVFIATQYVPRGSDFMNFFHTWTGMLGFIACFPLVIFGSLKLLKGVIW